MKKLFILLSIFFPLYSFSQAEEGDKKIHFGIKSGVAFSGVTPKKFTNNGTVMKYDRVAGIVYGVRVEIPVEKKLLLLTEASMTSKGAKIYYGNNSSGRSEYSVFLDIIPNLLYKIPAKSGIFMIGGGPFAGFNLSEYQTLLGKNDFGINLLAAYRIPIGFSVEINFNKGFVKQKPENSYPEVPDNRTTNYFGIAVGYMF